jgi:uncharacterized NAD-dependent epimerase/dehydratase family protein
MILLTDGYSDPHTAKTAICTIRYRPEEVAAVLDCSAAGRTSQDLFGVGGAIPVVGRLADAPVADTLVIGIAPPGGKIPPPWRAIILEAIRRDMRVISGLHDFLSEDAEFSQAAAEHGVELVDLRRSDEHDVNNRRGIRANCLRLHTIANDCSCGKMVAAIEVAGGLNRAGVDAAFVATGQTGILVAGGGCAVDRVIADFVAGAAEKLVLTNQHHDVIVVEGQGSLFQPRYSGVTLSLLHGLMPDGLILCYEMGRQFVSGMEEIRLPPLGKVIEFYEAAANIMHPCRVIGIAVNGQFYADQEVADECRRAEAAFGLPACDVIRQGPEKLVEAVLQLKRERENKGIDG